MVNVISFYRSKIVLSKINLIVKHVENKLGLFEDVQQAKSLGFVVLWWRPWPYAFYLLWLTTAMLIKFSVRNAWRLKKLKKQNVVIVDVVVVGDLLSFIVNYFVKKIIFVKILSVYCKFCHHFIIFIFFSIGTYA